MFMIVESGGMQFRIEPHGTVRVPLRPGEVGQMIDLDRVLACEDEHGLLLGKPFVYGAMARATVVGHWRGPKIRGFKFKRRKNYRRHWGHRQGYTELRVDELVVPR